jgi:cytoskeleton protein RodZ
MTMPQSPESDSSIRAPGPGSQLRQARTDLKLAPEDVARILHLSPRQILALENDDYLSLPGPTYVRGYLRGYAQLLGLSTDSVVETYNRATATAKPMDLGKLMPKAEIRSDHQLIKLATAAVVVIVVGLSAVWWQEQEKTPDVAVQESTTSTMPDESTGSGIADPLAQSDVAPEGLTGEVPVLPAPSTEMPASVAKAPVTPERPSAPATKPEPDANVTPEPPAPAPKRVVGTPSHLVIRAEADSWVDVKDVNGSTLIYQLVPAGSLVTADGVAPLQVYLGNADGVRVEFEGQEYDIAPHKRGVSPTVRFVLRKQAAQAE